MALLLPSTPPGALTDREKLWLAMRELRTFSLRDLYLETKIDRRTGKARDYLVGLLRAGILEEISMYPAGNAHIVWSRIAASTHRVCGKTVCSCRIPDGHACGGPCPY